MKDFWKEPKKTKEKKVNKKKVIITIIAIIIILFLIIISAIYINNKNVRLWIDKNIFRKEVIQNNLPTIELNESDTQNIYAFNKYIGVLSKNQFAIYDNSGKKQDELNIEITKPIFNSNGRHLVIAEEKGQKVYLITDKGIAWEKSIEGNISQVEVNKNGYVAITIVDTINKTVVAVYDNTGNWLFNNILSTTRVVSTSLSNDNKYLALAEIDTSGTQIQSSIKVMSIEEGKNNPSNSIKKVYNSEKGDLITQIKYQEKDKLLCMYTDKIDVIKTDETTETISENKDKKVSFTSISLSNSAVMLEEKSSGLFTADSIVSIINPDNKNISTYTTEAVTKEIYTYDNIIGLNLGAEVEFINTSGWLVKKYTAEQEITNIVLSSSMAGIVYRDKIELINL
ncbi:MAG: hypothetical protein BHW00_04570 [Clostridium sp. 26_22]|nr:MAG: hypothetical protein BHW00_04570 [Clostridium sp. 26_22]